MSIVVIEDDTVVAETLVQYLERAGYTAVSASDGQTGLALAAAPEASLVILDLMIPKLPGLEVCRRLRATSTIPILMLTARASEDDRITGLRLGADDYVAKPFSPREVVARVEALLRRATTAAAPPPPAIVIGDLEIDVFARQARVGGVAVTLTATEFRILETLGRAPGRVFTREELLARAFGPDYDGVDRTIDVHITNLRKKLEPHGRPQYLLTARGVGYRLARPSEL